MYLLLNTVAHGETELRNSAGGPEPGGGGGPGRGYAPGRGGGGGRGSGGPGGYPGQFQGRGGGYGGRVSLVSCKRIFPHSRVSAGVGDVDHHSGCCRAQQPFMQVMSAISSDHSFTHSAGNLYRFLSPLALRALGVRV